MEVAVSALGRLDGATMLRAPMPLTPSHERGEEMADALIEQCSLGEIRQCLLRQFGRDFQADAKAAVNATSGGQSSHSVDSDAELF
jgi:hypothetical protein